MNRGTWKARERWWAEQLGGQRVPVTGRQRGSAPDVEHPKWAIEVKAGKVLSTRMQTAIAQAEAAAQRTDKVPLVCLSHTRRGTQGNINVVMLKLEDFQALIGGNDE